MLYLIVSIPDLCNLTYFFDRVLILSGTLSGNGKISCWQAFSNARDYIQEAFCYLCLVSLKSSVTSALEEYVCKLYQLDAHVV